MADVKISNLPAGAAITGVEVAPVVQGGATVKTPISAILTYVQGAIQIAEGQVTNLPADLLTLSNAIGSEATTRANADSALSSAIGSEATTRANADSALSSAIGSEATTRANADALLAPLASPAFSAVPTAPTAAPGTNTTQLATTAFVAAAAGAVPYTNLTYSGLTPGAVLRATGAAAAAFGAVDLAVAAAITGILPAANGGSGVNNAGTLTNANNTTITGGGTLALAGFTLTVPATGSAALLGVANVFTAAQAIAVNDAVTNTTTTLATFGHNSSGTPAASFGSRLLFNLASATVADRNAAAIDTIWTTATDGTRTSALVIRAVTSTTLTEQIRFGGGQFLQIAGSGSAVNASALISEISSYDGGSTKVVLQGQVYGNATLGNANFVGVRGLAQSSANAYSAASYTGMQGEINFQATGGTLAFARGAYGMVVNAGAATITAAASFHAAAVANSGGGVVTTAYGLLIDNQSVGAANYAIFTNAGVVRLGDTIVQAVGDATTNVVTTVQTFGHNGGVVAAGFGSRQLWNLESSTTNDQNAMDWTLSWATATHASRKARIVGNVYDTAAREWIRGEADGANPMVGFLGAAASARIAAGAATAGAVYTATEQAMLQKVYDMGRTFGFLT